MEQHTQQNTQPTQSMMRRAAEVPQPQPQPKTKTQQAEELDPGVCPKCGTRNDPEALFCENCGTSLRQSVCPKCGAEIEPGLDYCEHCHEYLDSQHCSFCGGAMSEADMFCTTCGSPRGGLMCPVCHTTSRFSFCECCGQPLTDSARRELRLAWDQPFREEVQEIEDELERLMMTVPVAGFEERKRRMHAENIRQRVRELLAKEDLGYQAPPKVDDAEQVTPAELKARLMEYRQQLQRRLDKMAMGAQPSSAIARNVAMACRPHLSRLGWRCNWKGALHPSPLNCACPQKGGKWVVLDDKNETELTKD